MSGPQCKSQAGETCLFGYSLAQKEGGSLQVCMHADASTLPPLLRIQLSLALNIHCLLLLFQPRMLSAILYPINQL